MSLSTTSAAVFAFLTLTAVASTLPDEEAGARAEIVRIGPGIFRSVTSVRAGTDRIRVDEEVTLDADEHLVRAYIRVDEQGLVPTSTWIDRTTSSVVVMRGAEITRLRAPADAPWVYAPPETATHGAIATALGAWVVARAAAAGPVRIVHPDRSELVPADQVLVTTDEGAVAVVGDDPVDLDARFATTAHLRSLGETLTRTEESANRWVLTGALPVAANF